MAAAASAVVSPCRLLLAGGSSSRICSSGALAMAAFRSSFKGLALSASVCSSRTEAGAQRGMAPIVAAAGYKMKTHKASAKRFKVTGSGKIVRRQAGKAHLLRKKNSKRRNRLTGTTDVFRGDYDNVIGALPYLKVTR